MRTNRINSLHVIRTAMRLGVLAYGLYLAAALVDNYQEWQIATVDAAAETMGTLADCATDTECMLAEAAAVKAVAKERALRSTGGGGREMVAAKR